MDPDEESFFSVAGVLEACPRKMHCRSQCDVLYTFVSFMEYPRTGNSFAPVQAGIHGDIGRNFAVKYGHIVKKRIRLTGSAEMKTGLNALAYEPAQ